MEIRKNINGEMLTLDETTNKNKRLIWSVANRYFNKGKIIGLEAGDLFSIASIGFIKAFEKFDPETYQVKFSTYAVPMMIGEIQRYFRDNSGDLKFSRTIYEISNKIAKEEMEDEPIETLMVHFDEDETAIKNALYYLRFKKANSINATVFQGEGDEITLQDQLADKNNLSDYSKVHVNEFLESLSDRDRKVIEMVMYGENQNNIGKAVGVSQVQVSRIIKKLYTYAERFFGYPVGYFQNRPATNEQKEERKMKKKVKKAEPRSKKGDLERAKELLATTKMTPCKVAKETGINDSSAYYWAKKIRDPQADEAPVTISHIEIKHEEVEERKEIAEAMENMFKSATGVPAETFEDKAKNVVGRFVETKSINVELGVPEADIDWGETTKATAVNQEEEKRQSVLSKAKRSFNYEIASNDVTPSEIHTIFTQVGHAASASGIEKLNVNVAVTTENIG